MSKYIIRLNDFRKGIIYIKGGTFMNKGERHAKTTPNKSEAIRYKTEAGAKKAIVRLMQRCSNLPPSYNIVEIDSG